MNAIKHAIQHAWSKFDRERQEGRDDIFSDAQAVGVFVNLHEAFVFVQPDDLTDELLGADANDVVHFRALEVLDDHGWPGDFLDFACHWLPPGD